MISIKRISSALLTLVAAFSLLPASATVVFDNGLPNAIDGNETTAWLQSEDFAIAGGAAITGAGVYFAGRGGIGAWDGVVDYFLFGDAGGTPGALLASGAGSNVATVDSGIAWCCGGNAFLLTFDFASAFNAIAGTTYWFGIHLSSDYNRDEIYWVQTSTGLMGAGQESNGGTMNNWASNGRQHAYYLVAEQRDVPEPASILLLGLGLLALRRRMA